MRRITVLLICLLSTQAFAQSEIPAPVKLGDGEIVFARGEDEEITVTFAGREIYRNYYVRADQPIKVDDEDVVLIAVGPGGNACGPSTLIVTLPEGTVDAQAVIVGEECGSPTPSVNANEILFVPYLVPGAKDLVKSWAPSTGLVSVGEISYVPKAGSTWGNFDAKTADRAHAVLDNAEIYAATMTLVGSKFDELVLLLGVSGPPELINGKYVAAFGCQPHACGVANGFLGLDLGAKTVYAATRFSEGTETFWPVDFKAWPQVLQNSYEASKQP